MQWNMNSEMKPLDSSSTGNPQFVFPKLVDKQMFESAETTP